MIIPIEQMRKRRLSELQCLAGSHSPVGWIGGIRTQGTLMSATWAWAGFRLFIPVEDPQMGGPHWTLPAAPEWHGPLSHLRCLARSFSTSSLLFL